MGSEELRREYESMTGRKVKPASSSKSIGGPIWSFADWLLAKRDGVSLFATGLAVFAVAASLVIALRLATPFLTTQEFPLILFLISFALQYIAGIFILIGVLTMLAGAIRIGTNADHQTHTHRNPQNP